LRKKDVAYAAKRMVSLYDSWGKTAQAAAWRKTLASIGNQHEPEL
jgi:hypothetical protein